MGDHMISTVPETVGEPPVYMDKYIMTSSGFGYLPEQSPCTYVLEQLNIMCETL